MRRQTDRRIADDPPVDPNRVMPVVAAAIIGLAVVLVLLGVWSLHPLVAGAVSTSASPLAVSTVVFGILVALLLLSGRRLRPVDAR